MASYTMRLSEIVDDYSYGHYFANEREKIEVARKKIFNFDYPIFDEAYKKIFETNFIRHFYMREIGFETDGLFKFQLESWLLLHMPYFNKMYESELIQFDPLVNAKLDLTHNKNRDKLQNDNRDVTQNASTTGKSKTDANSVLDGTSTGKASGTTKTTDDNFERDLESNNPDSRLSITSNDGEGVIEYASKINESNENNKRDTASNEDTSTKANSKEVSSNNTNAESESDAKQKDVLVSNINDVEDFVQHRVGKVGIQTFSEMLMLYRKSFVRIEKEMFKEMQELFMLVY